MISYTNFHPLLFNLLGVDFRDKNLLIYFLESQTISIPIFIQIGSAVLAWTDRQTGRVTFEFIILVSMSANFFRPNRLETNRTLRRSSTRFAHYYLGDFTTVTTNNLTAIFLKYASLIDCICIKYSLKLDNYWWREQMT